jgi:hypothetical protein
MSSIIEEQKRLSANMDAYNKAKDAGDRYYGTMSQGQWDQAMEIVKEQIIKLAKGGKRRVTKVKAYPVLGSLVLSFDNPKQSYTMKFELQDKVVAD